MRQIFLLILLFVVGQWFVKALRRAQTHTRPGSQQQASRRAANGGAAGASRGGRARAGTASLPEPMVRCAECGVHAPRSESVSAIGQSFCCDQHARQYAARAAGQDRAPR
ncbi:MAG TPA: PP0621 family protein [Paraburkholderia sp.]|jgi:uncharacterized protein|nr:PP0621 family protein [Paraburkholderia sp.]